MLPDKRVKVTVQNFEALSRGRIRVKIAEAALNILDLSHKGKHYVVKNLGRGRYVMREKGKANDV